MGSNRFIFIIPSPGGAATSGNARPAYEGVLADATDALRGSTLVHLKNDYSLFSHNIQISHVVSLTFSWL